jgi:hypothetical protein
MGRKNVGAVLVIEDNLLKKEYCLKRLCQKNCVEESI